MIVSINKNKILYTLDEVLIEYGEYKKIGRYKTQSTDLYIPKGIKINCICNSCKTNFIWVYRNEYKKRIIENDIHCSNCQLTQTHRKKYGVPFFNNSKKIKETKLERYGNENYNNLEKNKKTKLEKYGNENYNNRKKGVETCFLLYGRGNNIHKGHNKGIPKSEEHKKKLSDSAKLRYKKNPPVLGRKMSEESLIKMKESNSLTWARKINNGEDLRKKNNNYKSGQFYSIKNNKKIHYRSSYEMQFYQLLEMANSVLNYEVESLRIPYILDKVTHHYIPDVKVNWDFGKTDLIEIKPSKLQKDPVNILKFESAKKYCLEKEITFKVFTKGEFFKYILSTTPSGVIPFSNKFMKKLDDFTSSLNIEEFK